MTNPKTLARTKNPQTSKDAAEKMVKSGYLNKQEEQVYDAILGWDARHSDFTTKDIARWMALHKPYLNAYRGYDICRKRFSGLERKGKIEVIWYKGLEEKRRDGCRVWRLL